MACENDPVVSVIVLTYNHKPYIKQALEGILEQETTFPVEILVGDDASTDGTSEIVREYATKYPDKICAFVREENMGATNNLFDLQIRAQGAFVAYLDGDDYWDDPHKLKKQVSFLKAHEGYIACTHRCCLVDVCGIPQKNQTLRWLSEKTQFTLNDFKGIVLPGHLSTLVHRNTVSADRDVLQALITAHPVIGDRSLFLYLLSKGPIYNLPDTMSCYRQIRSGKGDNATASVFKNNPNRVRDDYLYTKCLEHHAEQLLCVDGGFISHKRDLFTSAVWSFLRQPSKMNGKFTIEMLREGPAWDYLWHLPARVVAKAINRNHC